MRKDMPLAAAINGGQRMVRQEATTSKAQRIEQPEDGRRVAATRWQER